MTCQEFWSLMQASPAPGPQADGTPADRLLLDHISGCVSCADLMERQRALRAGLRRMAAEQAGLKAPASVEAALLRQFRAHEGSADTPARAGLGWLGMLTGKTLAAALAAAALAAILVSYRAPLSSVLAPSPSEVEDAAYLDSGFVPLPFAGEAPPNGEADVVRVEVSRATLVALGVPMADQATGGTVEAELVLGLGGMPQAVRVIE